MRLFANSAFVGLVIFALSSKILVAAMHPALPDQVNLPIPPFDTGSSNGPATISKINLPISLYETITDVNVHLDLTHTSDGDLMVSLIGPGGTQVLLAQQRGGSGDNFTATIFDDEAVQPVSAGTAPFTGSFRPESPLSWVLAPQSGEWQLKIQDVSPGATGTLLGWALEVSSITNQFPTRRNPQWSAAYSGHRIFTDAQAGTNRFKRCFIVNGNTIRSFVCETNHATNLALWSHTLGATPTGLAVAADDGGDQLFVVTDDAHLYHLDGTAGSVVWARDFRKPSCPLGDQFVTDPIIQPYWTASAAFQQAFLSLGFGGQDGVFLGTAYGCGNTSGNRAYLVPGAHGATDTAWIYNDFGVDMVDRIRGLALDPAGNALFITSQGALHVQPSVYAVSTLDGSVKWAADAGPVRTKPVVAGDHLYVMTYRGALLSLNVTNGSEFWNFPVTTNTVSKEIDYAPDYQVILVADDGGVVHGIVDVGGFAEVAWPDPVLSHGAETSPRYALGTAKFYVGGGASAIISQCDLLTGMEEFTYEVDANRISDLILDSPLGAITNRLLVATSGGNGKLVRFYIPFDLQFRDGASREFISADLEIEQVPVTSLVALGEQFTYTFHVFNSRPYEYIPASGDEARPVWVTNTIPDGLSINSVSLSQGTFSISSHQLIANLDAMTNGAMATITIGVTATNIGTFTNVARVTTPAPSYYEAQPDNNITTSTITVAQRPLLRIRQVNDTVELSWPTNLPGFTLQRATGLNSLDWTQAYPLPLVVGNKQVVTNGISSIQQYYRLRK